MRYVIAENIVIMEVVDDSIIRTSHEIMEFDNRQDAIEYFQENNIDYSILFPENE